MKIGIISIGYGDDFDFEEFYQNIEKYFLANHTKTFYFFTNKTEHIYKKNVNIYYANKNKGLFSNLVDLISDVNKDNIELLYFCGLTNKFNIKSGSQMLPNDNNQYVSINDQDQVNYYNFEGLLEHIQYNEDEMVYGSYVENFIKLVKHFESS